MELAEPTQPHGMNAMRAAAEELARKAEEEMARMEAEGRAKVEVAARAMAEAEAATRATAEAERWADLLKQHLGELQTARTALNEAGTTPHSAWLLLDSS